MIEGETRTITQICKRRTCEECGEPATAQLTFLLPNARINPASSAYGGDDISWCSDGKVFVCREHEELRHSIGKRLGMEWCALFPYNRFPHLFLYWEEVEQGKK